MSGKIGCWTPLDVAISLAGKGVLPDIHVGAWKQALDSIRRWIEPHCWSEAKAAYVMTAGDDALDASLPLAAPFGYPELERLDHTRQAIQAELGSGNLLFRYSGMEKEEGCFIACSFWCVETLAMYGHLDGAREMMDELLELAGSDHGGTVFTDLTCRLLSQKSLLIIITEAMSDSLLCSCLQIPIVFAID